MDELDGKPPQRLQAVKGTSYKPRQSRDTTRILCRLSIRNKPMAGRIMDSVDLLSTRQYFWATLV